MSRVVEKRCRRLGTIVLASLLLAQVAISLHKVTHGDALQETLCSLCVSASHASGPPPAGFSVALTAANDEPASGSQPGLHATRVVSPYQSRAPPQSF